MTLATLPTIDLAIPERPPLFLDLARALGDAFDLGALLVFVFGLVFAAVLAITDSAMR
jgi:hypothetical protein